MQNIVLIAESFGETPRALSTGEIILPTELTGYEITLTGDENPETSEVCEFFHRTL
jgi:hypothetical protein